MAVSRSPGISGSVSWSNFITDAKIINYTDQNPLYPVSNLLDPNMSQKYRTSRDFSERNGYFEVVFDLGSSKLPTIFALIGTNISKTSGSGAYLMGSANPDLSSPFIYDAFPLYESRGNILRWYIDTPSSGGPAYIARYWSFRMYPSDWGNGFTTDGYFEFSNIWLGEYVEFNQGYDRSISLTDISNQDKSFSGALYSDENHQRYEVFSKLPLVSRSNRQSIINSFETYGSNKHVLLDLAAYSVSDGSYSHDVFYGKVDKSIDLEMIMDGYGEVSMNFVEAVG